jgi:hypothetical protein
VKTLGLAAPDPDRIGSIGETFRELYWMSSVP